MHIWSLIFAKYFAIHLFRRNLPREQDYLLRELLEKSDTLGIASVTRKSPQMTLLFGQYFIIRPYNGGDTRTFLKPPSSLPSPKKKKKRKNFSLTLPCLVKSEDEGAEQRARDCFILHESFNRTGRAPGKRSTHPEDRKRIQLFVIYLYHLYLPLSLSFFLSLFPSFCPSLSFSVSPYISRRYRKILFSKCERIYYKTQNISRLIDQNISNFERDYLLLSLKIFRV